MKSGLLEAPGSESLLGVSPISSLPEVRTFGPFFGLESLPTPPKRSVRTGRSRTDWCGRAAPRPRIRPGRRRDREGRAPGRPKKRRRHEAWDLLDLLFLCVCVCMCQLLSLRNLTTLGVPLSVGVLDWFLAGKKQDGAHEPECKHDRKATYVQMTLL